MVGRKVGIEIGELITVMHQIHTPDRCSGCWCISHEEKDNVLIIGLPATADVA
jgi:hypothetical protein